MVWSGVTKYLRQVCQVQMKPIELPGVGIFMPVNQKQETTRLTANALGKMDPKDLDVHLMVSTLFLGTTSHTVEKNNPLISTFNPNEG